MERFFGPPQDKEMHIAHDYTVIVLRNGRREEITISSRDLKKEALQRILHDPQFPVSHSEEQKERALKLLVQITMHKILAERAGVAEHSDVVNKSELTSFVYDDADDVVRQLLKK